MRPVKFLEFSKKKYCSTFPSAKQIFEKHELNLFVAADCGSELKLLWENRRASISSGEFVPSPRHVGCWSKQRLPLSPKIKIFNQQGAMFVASDHAVGSPFNSASIPKQERRLELYLFLLKYVRESRVLKFTQIGSS